MSDLGQPLSLSQMSSIVAGLASRGDMADGSTAGRAMVMIEANEFRALNRIANFLHALEPRQRDVVELISGRGRRSA